MIKFDLTIEADHWVEMQETYIYNSANIHCAYSFKYCSRHQE